MRTCLAITQHPAWWEHACCVMARHVLIRSDAVWWPGMFSSGRMLCDGQACSHQVGCCVMARHVLIRLDAVWWPGMFSSGRMLCHTASNLMRTCLAITQHPTWWEHAWPSHSIPYLEIYQKFDRIDTHSYKRRSLLYYNCLTFYIFINWKRKLNNKFAISWEAFFDPSDSYFLFAEERGYHRWALAHSSWPFLECRPSKLYL
jgi:hypothetical protein